MRRRQYLATAAVGAGGALAGCTTLTNATKLRLPTEEVDGNAVHLRYETDDEVPLTVSHLVTRPTDGELYRVRTVIQHPGETAVESFRFAFSDGRLVGNDVRVFVDPLREGHYASARVRRDGDDVVVDVDDAGGTEGHPSFDVLCQPLVAIEELSHLRVDHEVDLAESGVFAGSYSARGYALIDLPGVAAGS